MNLVHDVFLVFWRRRGDFDEARALRPWLFGIAYRAVSTWRRRVFRGWSETYEHVDVAASEPLQDETLDRKRAKALVAKALATMDVDQRAVFILHDIDGENIAACARALGVSANTLYSRLRLAREKLARVARAPADVRGAA